MAGVGALETSCPGERDGREEPRAFSDVKAAEEPDLAESPKNSLRPEAAKGGFRDIEWVWLQFTIKWHDTTRRRALTKEGEENGGYARSGAAARAARCAAAHVVPPVSIAEEEQPMMLVRL